MPSVSSIASDTAHNAVPSVIPRSDVASPCPAHPLIALAPMAGVTDLPFRSLCEQLGADYSVSEMAASAPQLLDSDKNQLRLAFPAGARQKILQIIGNDARQMARAARHYAVMGADSIDINLGCPAKKVSKKGAGSALLSDLSLVADILTAVVKACPVPVTVKTRLGTTHDNYTLFEVATIANDLGIKQLTVHGRTRACKFNGIAQFEEIARVKRAFPQLRMIANGDIDSPARARAVLEQTGCEGLMIGRSAVGRPWLFSEIRQQLDEHFVTPPIDKKAVVLEHIRQTHQFYGGVKGVRFARKHLQGYCHYFGIEKHFRALAKIDHPAVQLEHVKMLLEEV